MTRLSSLCYCAVFFNFVAWYYIVAIVSHINLIFYSVFNLKLPRRQKVPRIAQYVNTKYKQGYAGEVCSHK